MEPLSAIGLASNVLQFVEFAARLISTGTEVYESASGTTERTLELERIYKDLSNFGLKLQDGGAYKPWGFTATPASGHNLEDIENQAKLHMHFTALKGLAVGCKAVCDQLLETLGKLKADEGRWRGFRSFKAALKTIWNDKKIDELESRINRFRSTMLSHYFQILSAQLSGLLTMVGNLKQESSNLSVDQSLGLNRISGKLDDISGMISTEIHEASYRIGILESSKLGVLEEQKINLLSESVSAITLGEEELRNVANEQVILRSLNFPSRPVRHDNIPVAHNKTFQWALTFPPEFCDEDSSNDDDEPQFATWLRSGDSFFWVSGKAGSGKSTFMKFVADQELTRKILEEWAQPNRLVIATHYFWSAGTLMQKSKEGLLRTLLHEIFRACPALMSQACPRRWEHTRLMGSCLDIDWTIHELFDALKHVATLSDVGVRFGIFIDGIDEFDGDHYELCTILQTLSRSNNIKLCLAGRPWNVFEDYFGQDGSRKIYIHDLTHDDIREFTTNRLMEHPRWNHRHFQSKEMGLIIDEITDKAQGVFLWVFLVTKSLREGLTNGDTIRDLQNRLRSLPSDLEKFFRHMLDLVGQFYCEKMAHTFLVAANANEPLHFLLYSMLDKGFEEPDYALNLSYCTSSEGQCQVLKDECKRRINARCGGLLELTSSETVEFLHRTVRDFLRGPEMDDYLKTKSDPHFVASLSTLKAYVAVMKSDPESFFWKFYGTREVVRQALVYANDAIDDDPDSAFEHLEELRSCAIHWINTREKDPDTLRTFENAFVFEEEILKTGVDKFVTRVLRQNPHYFNTMSRPPLTLILNSSAMSPQHIRIIRELSTVAKESIHKYRVYFHLLSQIKFSELFLSRVMNTESPAETRFIDTDEKGNTLDLPEVVFSHEAEAMSWTRSQDRPDQYAREIIADLLGVSEDTPPRAHDDLKIIQEKICGLDPAKVQTKNLKFFAAVVEIVIRYGKQIGWDMDFLLPTIQEVLPDVIKTTLGELMCRTAAARDVRVGLSKRAADSGFEESPGKRRMLNTNLT